MTHQLDTRERRELRRLFEFIIKEAGQGNSWPPGTYVDNVQAVLDGEDLQIDEDEDA